MELAHGRHAERDAWEIARGRVLLDDPTGSAWRSDELLAAGAAGLRFFDMFGPLYSRYTAVPFDVEREIYGPFRRLAGMDFAALRRDSAALQACGQSLAVSTGVLRSSFVGLASRWWGHAASNAMDHVVAVLGIADRLNEDTAAVGRACGHLADALEGVVRSYASAALSLHSPTCATGSPALVDSLIEFVMHRTTAAQPVARQVLDEDFVPTFEERLRAFREEVVARHEDDIRALWSAFHDATSVENVPENPFAGISPVGPPAVAPPAAELLTMGPPAAEPPAIGPVPMHSLQSGDPAGGEAVTIRHGASTVVAQSPDGSGSVRITADDGSGRTPQEHAVDLGADASGTRTQGSGTGQLDTARDSAVVFELGDVTVTAERIAGGAGLLVTIDGGTGEASRYLVDFHPLRGVTAHRVPDSDGIGAALGDSPVPSRGASLGRAGLSGAEPVDGVTFPDGGAVLGDAGPGGASLGSVADRERSGGGSRLPTELVQERDAREKLRTAPVRRP